jgi:Trypsin-like peptidase domain
MKKDALLFSLVRVVSGTSLGTGFLLKDAWIITCAHNIKDVEGTVFALSDEEGNFSLKLQAHLHKIIPEAEGDIACFRIESSLPQHSRPLLLTDSGCSEGNSCRVFGFPKSNPENGLPYNRAKIDSITSRSAEGWRQIILAMAEPVGAGFSGSPLWDDERNALVGMVLQQGTNGLSRAVPAEWIARGLDLPCYELSPYPGIERIDARFLYEQSTNPLANLTPESFYTADFSAQWWGVSNGLVADKVLFDGLPELVLARLEETAPVVVLLEGAGGMGKTTAARRLAVELHEQCVIWWLDYAGGENMEESFPEFIKNQQLEQVPTLLILDDWGKFSTGFQQKLLHTIHKQQRQPNGGSIRFAITARETDHRDLRHDLLAPNARLSFDGDKNLQIDNQALLKKALAFFDSRFAGLAQVLFSPDDRLLGKPFHLLFILLRAATDDDLRRKLDKVTHSAEGKFREILQYDFDQLYYDPEHRGLAVAMLFFAYVKIKHKYQLGKKAFLELANHYSPQATAPPAQRLAANPIEQWYILNHYLAIGKSHKDKREDAPELISFKKDEYPEILLSLKTTPAGFLDQEKKLIIEFLLKCNCAYSNSVVAACFCQLEPLFTTHDQVQIVEQLLAQRNSHHCYTEVFLYPGNLTSISFEQKWIWVKKYNEITPDNNFMHGRLITFLKKEKTNNWEEYVSNLVNLGANSNTTIPIYLKNLNGQEKILSAKKLIAESKSPDVLCACLYLLRHGQEGKFFAKKLITESTHPRVLCTCLNLLQGDVEGKFYAKKLIAESKHPNVLCTCLNLLQGDAEGKSFAKKLIAESKSPDVLCTCLNLLKGDTEGKSFAKKLIAESKSPDVLCTCLNLLQGDTEGKSFAKKLIAESKHHQVLCTCLNLLQGDTEGKSFAKKLIAESRHHQVLCICLNLLQDDAEGKFFAEKLIVESKDKEVICTCLRTLKNQNDLETGADFALSIISTWQKHDPKLVANSLNYLPHHPSSISLMRQILQAGKQGGARDILYDSILHYGYGQHDFWKKKIRGIILNWRTEYRDVVGSCLFHLEDEVSLVQPCCREILQRWKPELERIQNRRKTKKSNGVNDYFLKKALAHPRLRTLAYDTAQAMYQHEQTKADSITPHLWAVVKEIVESNVFPEWNTPKELKSENFESNSTLPL